MNAEKRKNVLAMFVMLFVALLLIAGSCYLLSLHKKGTYFQASPNNYTQVENDGFPLVDWSYWKSINEDIVAWISVPDTQINYPVVQAKKSNPRYYLTHDIYKNWNYTGAIYLDWECEEKGVLHSDNVVIFGHNMGLGDGTLFEPFQDYSDINFARAHERIYLQTPDAKLILSSFGVEVIDGSEPVKQVTFDNNDALQTYISERYSNCSVKLSEKPYKTPQLFTFCTCSYNFNPSNERTLVYATKQANI